MFSGCVSLVGGAGTVYDSGNDYRTYARIDGGPSAPGHLTGPPIGFDAASHTLMLKKGIINKDDVWAFHERGDVWYIVAEEGAELPAYCDALISGSVYESGRYITHNDRWLSLVTVDLSKADTSQVIKMFAMFSDCPVLETIDMSGCDTSRTMHMQYMFSECPALKTITVSDKWATSAAEAAMLSTETDMFRGCMSLKGGAGTVYDSAHTGLDYARIDGGISAPGYLTATKVPVTSVTLNKTTASLKVDGTVTLKATVKPDDATDKTVTWKSSKTSVATVSKGKVTAKAVGKATITATAGGKSAKCTITVTAADVAPTGITLDKTAASVSVGDTLTLTATVSPEDATDKTVTWSSDKPAVATVENGVVKAVAIGTAKITASTSNGKSTVCTVTVTAAPPAKAYRDHQDRLRRAHRTAQLR